MFDFSFSEIGLIAVVGLLVLGPERLPKVARTAGALLRRARASWQGVRDEIERELAAEDLKRSMREIKQAAADLRSDVQSGAAEIKSSVESPPPAGSPAASEATIAAPSGVHDERR